MSEDIAVLASGPPERGDRGDASAICLGEHAAYSCDVNETDPLLT
jgi:hypothetical protein